MRTVNVGLIGAGGIARLHALAYASAAAYFAPDLPAVRLRRVAEADAALARSAAERLRFEEWTADWEALVASPDIDVVSIATPNFLHAPMAIAAAAAGKHVFCEKPLSNTAADAERMCRAAEAAGIVHAVNFNYRKVPAIALHRAPDPGRPAGRHPGVPGRVPPGLGQRHPHPALVEVRGEPRGRRVADRRREPSHRPGPPPGRRAGPRRRDDRDLGEGAPAADLRRSPSTRCGATRQLAPVDVEDSAYFLGRFVGGAIGVFEISRCAPGRKNQLALEIHGSLGSVYFDYERANEVKVYLADQDAEAAGFRTDRHGPRAGRARPWSRSPASASASWRASCSRCATCLQAIAGGPAMSPDFHDGWRAQVVVESVLESAQKGWVSVPPPTGRGTGTRARPTGG